MPQRMHHLDIDQGAAWVSTNFTKQHNKEQKAIVIPDWKNNVKTEFEIYVHFQVSY